MKYIKHFKIFEEIDAFSRVGKKLWVELESSGVGGIFGGDERIYYIKRYEPTEIHPSEMLKLKELFNKFNGHETSIDKEIPSDNGYYVNIGSFSVKLNCGGTIVPFNFHKRSDEWWLINCKIKYPHNPINWCYKTNLYGSTWILCDSIEGIEEFLNDCDHRIKLF